MIETKQLELGILPVENSTNGAVVTAMDMLPKLENSIAVGETVLDIKHCLVSIGASIAELKYVYSHE